MFLRPLQFISTLVLIAVPLTAQTGPGVLIHQFDGIAFQDRFGHSVSGAGDVDGDGIPDIITGSPYVGASGVAIVYSGATGDILYRIDGGAINVDFGFDVDGAGDVNGDGFDDFIVGDPGAIHIGSAEFGSAFVYSGATGLELYRFDGVQTWDYFGGSVSGAGDVNGDGFDDFIVGASGANNTTGQSQGAAFVYSGVDGALLFHKQGSENSDRLGTSVADAGDLDSDGYADFIVGAVGERNSGIPVGGAYVYSGATGAILAEFHGSDYTSLGSAVANAGDVDGDGTTDLLVGNKGAGPLGLPGAGSVFVYSGLTNAIIHRFDGPFAYNEFGSVVDSAGDVNGDGLADIIIGAPRAHHNFATRSGTTYVYSGADGAVILEKHGDEEYDALGNGVAGVGDINQDGFDDVAIGAPGATVGLNQDIGSVFVLSLFSYLLASVDSFSASAGGLVSLTLDFPDDAALYEYKILMSTTGPGSIQYGVEIPLAMDNMVMRTFLGNYPYWFSADMQGQLDINGNGLAVVGLPAGLYTHLVGTSYWLAAIANPQGALPEYSSIAIPIEILP